MTISPPERAERAWTSLLPFNGAWRLASAVVDDPVDAAHLVDNACAHPLENLPWHSMGLGSHVVGGRGGTQGEHALVGSGVAHNTHALAGQQDRERLPNLFVLASLSQLLDVDVIRFPKQVARGTVDWAEDSNRKAWAWERVAHDRVLGETEGKAELADLHFESDSG